MFGDFIGLITADFCEFISQHRIIVVRHASKTSGGARVERTEIQLKYAGRRTARNHLNGRYVGQGILVPLDKWSLLRYQDIEHG